MNSWMIQIQKRRQDMDWILYAGPGAIVRRHFAKKCPMRRVFCCPARNRRDYSTFLDEAARLWSLPSSMNSTPSMGLQQTGHSFPCCQTCSVNDAPRERLADADAVQRLLCGTDTPTPET